MYRKFQAVALGDPSCDLGSFCWVCGYKLQRSVSCFPIKSENRTLLTPRRCKEYQIHKWAELWWNLLNHCIKRLGGQTSAFIHLREEKEKKKADDKFHIIQHADKYFPADLSKQSQYSLTGPQRVWELPLHWLLHTSCEKSWGSLGGMWS